MNMNQLHKEFSNFLCFQTLTNIHKFIQMFFMF